MVTASFPDGFFRRGDERDDGEFYSSPRYVAHIDAGAIAAVGALYDELEIRGEVLDLMSSWISHFRVAPTALTVLGMSADELAANPQARSWVVHDLNANPVLPFGDDVFDHATCCVSVDYLTRPVEVFRDVARVLRPGGVFVCAFSNRLFPTKAISGWLHSESATHMQIVTEYFGATGKYQIASTLECATPVGGDPLYAVWARVI